MCGIFGYVGKQEDAPANILSGLRILEYRGYDSWGIAVKKQQQLVVEKHVGKIGSASVNLPKSQLGIGHTRWATHGGVVEKNAHPHLDCTKEIAVVHNGIVENYAEISSELRKKGHVFSSDTDTEVIAHLIEEYKKTHGFASSVRLAFNKITGLNAVVVAFAPSQEIVACKTGSPLVVGVTDDAYYIASDTAGLLPYTKKILFVKDNEMVIMGKSFQLISLPNGKKVTPKFEIVDWKYNDVKKGSYPHFMLKEIYEQVSVMEIIAKTYDLQIKEFAELIARAKGTFFIGAGTAYHATLLGTYLFSKVAKIHVNTSVASEFMCLEDFLTSKSLIIPLSQSGETIDVIEPLNRLKEKKSTVAAITNVLGSTIYRMADKKMLLGAGVEKAVASTKAYIAKVSILYLLAYELAGKKSVGKKQLIGAVWEAKRLLSPQVIKNIKSIAGKLAKSQHIYIIGRGMSYPIAMEAALKIKEVSYIHTEGVAGGELKHGTIALIEKGTPCIVFAPNDETYDAVISNAIEIKTRGAMLIGISHKNLPIFDHFIEVKDIGDASALVEVIPAQLLSYYLAVIKGFDPDKPRNLAKSVTVK